MIDRLSAVCGRVVSRETFQRVEAIATAIIAANQQQNLVAASTVRDFFERHIIDSAQLLPLVDQGAGPLLDIGSGAGLPGLILAALDERPITLVEPRRLRVAFLESVVRDLDLGHVSVRLGKVEALDERFPVITARAVANLGTILGISQGVMRPDTIFILPKGQRVHEELAQARQAWHGDYQLVSSVTGDGAIVVARNVKRKGKT